MKLDLFTGDATVKDFLGRVQRLVSSCFLTVNHIFHFVVFFHQFLFIVNCLLDLTYVVYLILAKANIVCIGMKNCAYRAMDL